MLPRQIIELEIIVRLSRRLNEAPVKEEPLYLEVSISIFERRTNFSLALKKVGSYTRGFTVQRVKVIVGRQKYWS